MPFVVVGQVQGEWQAEEHDVGDGLDDRIVEIEEEVLADEGEHIEVSGQARRRTGRQRRQDARGMTRSALPPRSGRRTAGRRAGRTPPSRPGRRSSARRAETACRSGRVRRHHGERRGGTSDGHLSARANRAPAPARVAVVLGLRRRRPLPRDGHEPAVRRPRRPPADRPPHPPDGPRAELFPDWRHFITNRTQDITSLRPSTVTTPSTNRSSPSPRTKRWRTSPPDTSPQLRPGPAGVASRSAPESVRGDPWRAQVRANLGTLEIALSPCPAEAVSASTSGSHTRSSTAS